MENNVPKSILNRGTIDEIEAMTIAPPEVTLKAIKQEEFVDFKRKRKRLQASPRVSKRMKTPSYKFLENFSNY
jgi:hypothetical protein